jgi:SHS2 domain-containing protein
MSSSTVPQKRKAETEYSSNPHTIKATKRRESLDPRNKEWEDAKQLDAKAITYHQKKVKQSEAYQIATEEEKQRMLDRIEVEVMIGRYVPC